MKHILKALGVVGLILGIITGVLTLVAPDAASAVLEALQTISQGIQDLISAAEEGLDALEEFQETPTPED